MKTKDKQKKAIKLLENQGLLLASTPKQTQNGTLYFVDPKTMTGYSITKSGYMCRHIFGASYWGMDKNRYQLNPREGSFTITKPGKYVKLAKQLSKKVVKYRKYRNVK